jgi:hypothetical protein
MICADAVVVTGRSAPDLKTKGLFYEWDGSFGLSANAWQNP